MTGSQPPGNAIWPLPAARSVETAPHTRSRIPPAAPAPSGVSLGACARLSPSARVCAPRPAPRPRPPWAPAPPSSWLSPDTAFGAVSSPSLSRPSEISATWEQGPHPGPCCRSVCGTKEARTERLLTESPRRARWPRWGDSTCSRRVRPAVRGRDTGEASPPPEASSQTPFPSRGRRERGGGRCFCRRGSALLTVLDFTSGWFCFLCRGLADLSSVLFGREACDCVTDAHSAWGRRPAGGARATPPALGAGVFKSRLAPHAVDFCHV